MTLTNDTRRHGLARFSAPTACPYCGRPVQLASLTGRIPTRYSAGTDSPHRCLRVEWCPCGGPVHPLPDGRRINVADDQDHSCETQRASAVVVRAVLPVARPLPPTNPERPMPEPSIAALFDDEAGAA